VADLVRLAYYPFLPEVRDAVREVGPALPDLLAAPRYEGIRQRAMARIRGALADKRIPPVTILDERGALNELLSVPVARMLCVLVGDRTLTHRYASAEAARLQETLDHDPASRDPIARHLGLRIDDGADGMRMHFADYLAVAPLWEPEWKLIVRPVSRGWVPLSGPDLSRLCREALEKRIQTELDEEAKRPLPEELKAAFTDYVEQLKPELEQARANWSTGDFGPVQTHLFPPCIVHIFGQMKDGEMISHHARFAIASFLATIGMTADDIIDYFRAIPNFDPEKSRYQVTHIAGEQGVEKYTPPGCGTMQTNGVCPLEKRDRLCAKIKHPLSYYRARLRFQKEDQEKARQAVQQTTGGSGRPAATAQEQARQTATNGGAAPPTQPPEPPQETRHA